MIKFLLLIILWLASIGIVQAATYEVVELYVNDTQNNDTSAPVVYINISVPEDDDDIPVPDVDDNISVPEENDDILSSRNITEGATSDGGSIWILSYEITYDVLMKITLVVLIFCLLFALLARMKN